MTKSLPDHKFSHFQWSNHPPRNLSRGSFLRLHGHQVRHQFTDGSHGPYYEVEVACPPCLDAVVLVIYTLGPPIQVLLRHGLRPAAAIRTRLSLPPGSDISFPDIFWELPTGGVENSDWSLGAEAGLRYRAQQEGWEETGLPLPNTDFFQLGPASFPTPAFCPEQLYFMAIALPQPLEPISAPPGDGHPMEEGSWVRWLELDQALQWCRQGHIVDAKTEMGLRRLQEHLNSMLAD